MTDVQIATIVCGSCGHHVSAMHTESAKASMLEHLVYVHSETHRD